MNVCELCGRERRLTRHHLIPKTVHTKKKFIREFGKEEMRTRILMICKPCHKGLHDLLTEKELAECFNTRDQLLSNDKVRKHVFWSRKQK